jgi:hypothetical protein
MTPQEFAKLIRNHVVETSVAIHRMSLESTPQHKASPEYLPVLQFYSQGTLEQRSALIALVRRISIDTCAEMIGVIENAAGVPDLSGKFELRYEDTPIDNDAQDAFLALIEEEK